MSLPRIVSLISAVTILWGCATVGLQKTEKQKKALMLEEEIGKKDEEETERREQREIVRAIEYALSLERLIWDNRVQMGSREDVLGIFKRGFCSSKAEEITDYVWIEAIDRDGRKIHMLNPGEPILEAPDAIEVVESDDGDAKAILKYKDRLDGPVLWTGHTILATLKMEEGTWKICETKTEENQD